MALGSLTRRAFPYMLIACVMFALAFAVVYFFILPDAPPEDFASLSDSTSVSSPRNPEAPAAEDIMPDVQAPALPPDEPPLLPIVPITMPNLVGKDMWEAQQILDKMRLIVVLRRDTSSFELPNTVVRQSPPSGQRMVQGDTVFVTISQFPPPR